MCHLALTIFRYVVDAPVCVSGQKIQYGTSRNEPVQVTCQVDANPADVTFRWLFNSSIETLDLPFSQVSSPQRGGTCRPFWSKPSFRTCSAPI